MELVHNSMTHWCSLSVPWCALHFCPSWSLTSTGWQLVTWSRFPPSFPGWRRPHTVWQDELECHFEEAIGTCTFLHVEIGNRANMHVKICHKLETAKKRDGYVDLIDISVLRTYKSCTSPLGRVYTLTIYHNMNLLIVGPTFFIVVRYVYPSTGHFSANYVRMHDRLGNCWMRRGSMLVAASQSVILKLGSANCGCSLV